MQLGAMSMSDVFAPDAVSELSTNSWDAHKSVLARTLSSGEWRLVSKLYQRIFSFKVLARTGGPKREGSAERTQDSLAKTAELAREAAHMLHHQQLDVSPPSPS